MQQVKLLMVCLGNICRSPLAQGILESKVDTKKITVDSAGTAAYHIWNPPDPRSIVIAKKYGIDLSLQRARQFRREDFTAFSKIYVMDHANYKNIIALAQSEKEREKVALILSDNREVPDPYYGGEEGFQSCFDLLDEACERIKETYS
ncbi:MAG: low molecular weight phosphotyrosine protein phosphatase [Flavobacteriia bacterium]|nr:low molecular weight phosphotyrosine protein phosphatase [Flavobacteriia bacterium]